MLELLRPLRERKRGEKTAGSMGVRKSQKGKDLVQLPKESDRESPA